MFFVRTKTIENFLFPFRYRKMSQKVASANSVLPFPSWNWRSSRDPTMTVVTASATLIPDKFTCSPATKTESSLDLISTTIPTALQIRYCMQFVLFWFKTFKVETKPKGTSQGKGSINEAKNPIPPAIYQLIVCLLFTTPCKTDRKKKEGNSSWTFFVSSEWKRW